MHRLALILALTGCEISVQEYGGGAMAKVFDCENCVATTVDVIFGTPLALPVTIRFAQTGDVCSEEHEATHRVQSIRDPLFRVRFLTELLLFQDYDAVSYEREADGVQAACAQRYLAAGLEPPGSISE